MSALGERTLLAYLTDEEAVGYLSRIGVPEEIVPTPSMRPVVTFALRHFANTGKPPTTAMLLEEYGDSIEASEVNLDADPEESVEWALDDLKAGYARKESQKFTTEFAEAMSLADNSEKVDVIGEYASRLSRLAMLLHPRTTQIDMRTAADELLADYRYREANRGQIIGMRTGLDEFDQHIGGVWPGELWAFVAGTKVGKSWLLDFITYNEWNAGRIAALFTLENSVMMTQGRIACVALRLDANAWQRGTLPDDEVRRVEEWVHDVLKASDTPLPIFCPSANMRTPHAIVQTARAHEADSLVIDQLTFMNPTEEKRNQARTYEVRDIMHDLKELISTGSRPIPCALAHQVNREGIKAAEKAGFLRAYDMADSSEVERTVDGLVGIYQSAENKTLNRALLQIINARRVLERSWDMIWNVGNGLIRIHAEADLARFASSSSGEQS